MKAILLIVDCINSAVVPLPLSLSPLRKGATAVRTTYYAYPASDAVNDTLPTHCQHFTDTLPSCCQHTANILPSYYRRAADALLAYHCGQYTFPIFWCRYATGAVTNALPATLSTRYQHCCRHATSVAADALPASASGYLVGL